VSGLLKHGTVLVKFVLDGDDMMILLLVFLDQCNLLPVPGNTVLLLPDQVSKFHLLFNQVLSLSE
jgi:hypothetical protein